MKTISCRHIVDALQSVGFEKGRVVFFNADFQTCTYVHYVEQSLDVPCRFVKEFGGTIVRNGESSLTTCTYLVRPLDGSVVARLVPLEKNLLERGLLKKLRLGDGFVASIPVKVLVDETRKLLEENIYFLLKYHPGSGEPVHV